MKYCCKNSPDVLILFSFLRNGRAGVAANYFGNIFVYKKLFTIVKDGFLIFLVLLEVQPDLL